MHQWLERKLAPKEKPRELRLRRDHLPRVFRGNAPGLYPEDPAEALKKFRPPSVFAEYKVLSAVFLAVLLALAFYFLHSLWTAPAKPPARRPSAAAASEAPPAEPASVYVEMVPPPKEAQPAQPAKPAPTRPDPAQSR